MTKYELITLMAQMNLNHATSSKLKPKAIPVLPAFLELSDPYLENVSSNILQHGHNVQRGVILDFVSKNILQWKRQTI